MAHTTECHPWSTVVQFFFHGRPRFFQIPTQLNCVLARMIPSCSAPMATIALKVEPGGYEDMIARLLRGNSAEVAVRLAHCAVLIPFTNCEGS